MNQFLRQFPGLKYYFKFLGLLKFFGGFFNSFEIKIGENLENFNFLQAKVDFASQVLSWISYFHIRLISGSKSTVAFYILVKISSANK